MSSPESQKQTKVHPADLGAGSRTPDSHRNFVGGAAHARHLLHPDPAAAALGLVSRALRQWRAGVERRRRS